MYYTLTVLLVHLLIPDNTIDGFSQRYSYSDGGGVEGNKKGILRCLRGFLKILYKIILVWGLVLIGNISKILM